MKKIKWSTPKKFMAMLFIAILTACIILFLMPTQKAPETITVYRASVSKRHVSGLFGHDEYAFTGYTNTNAYVSGIIVGSKPYITNQAKMTVYRQNNRYYANQPKQWFK